MIPQEPQHTFGQSRAARYTRSHAPRRPSRPRRSPQSRIDDSRVGKWRGRQEAS